jgi:hypothetical protein
MKRETNINGFETLFISFESLTITLGKGDGNGNKIWDAKQFMG